MKIKLKFKFIDDRLIKSFSSRYDYELAKGKPDGFTSSSNMLEKYNA